MPSKRKKTLDLDKSMAELELVVAQLESGDLPLDQSLERFEAGVKLSRDCQAALADAEQKVQTLLKSGLADFDESGDAEG